MTNIKFSVLDHEGDDNIIDIICSVDDQLAVNLFAHHECVGCYEFLEKVYEDFCAQVPNIVVQKAGIRLSPDWIFNDSPNIVF